MNKIAIVLGSTRPGRNGDAVARWVLDIARRRGDAHYELVDLADYALPLLDEPLPSITGHYTQPHTKVWSATIASFDGFVFVTPEYNHSTTGALKNALDFLYNEWNDKAAGFVSYGGDGGTRAVEHLRLIMGELRVADVRAQVSLTLHQDFTDHTTFTPSAHRERTVETMLEQVNEWAGALAGLRATRTPATAA